jgi:hypothetical protein
MQRTRWTALALILLSSGLSMLWGGALQQSQAGLSDFKAIYYGARCLIQHSDPYKESELLRVYQAEGGELPSDPDMRFLFRRAMPVFINLPTTLLLIAPFALLAWGPAHVLWLLLLAGSLALAVLMTWNLAEKYAQGIPLFLICILAANCELIFESGRSAGLAVCLCIVAVWCFLQERFVMAGILCLAISLAIKPHDAGLVWFYFLLAGGIYRKRSLQTLVVLAVLGLPAVLWVSQVSPHWIKELHSNLSESAIRGGLGDPGPTSVSMRDPNRVIDLQTVISIFRDDPRIYNPVSYLICGALLLVWSVRTLRLRFSPSKARLALAAVVPLSMVISYHRSYDAKLLLLTIPACAMLWAEGGLIGWIAFLLNTMGVVLTGDIPAAALLILTKRLPVHTSGFFEQILIAILMRPVPLILLTMGIFYLWVYQRRTGPEPLTEVAK